MKWTLGLVGLWCFGCGCEPGTYATSTTIRSGPEDQTVSGPATIERLENVTKFLLGTTEILVDFQGVPADVFPDGAYVYAAITDRREPTSDPSVWHESAQVVTYDVEGPSPGTLRAAAWTSHTLPAFVGATFTTDGSECEREDDDHCEKHYVRVRVILDGGDSLSVLPGSQAFDGKLRMGNGQSSVNSGCSGVSSAVFMGYLAVEP